MSNAVEQVRAYARQNIERTLERLGSYLSLPAISCDAAHRVDVQRLAEAIRNDLERAGLHRARLCTLDGALPVVAAERLDAGANRPTLLIYGHLDIQPVAGESWNTPPHVATRIGDRLYARGSSDDMGGWMSHVAALEAWMAAVGRLPINIKLVIESEEEIGSPNLSRYMDEFPDVFSADVMVLTDCENPSTEVPGLTVALRGLYEVEVRCEALASDVHSGIWGNMAPDPGNALIRLLARLLDDDGRLSIGRMDVEPDWREAAQTVPLNDDVVREGARLLEGVEPLPHRGLSPAEWLWRQPAITVVSTTLPTAAEKKNAIRGRASATLSIRLAPGQDRNDMRALLERALLSSPAPAGVRVTLIDKPGGAESWLYEPKGPAFDAANRAYESAWGHRLIPIGVGGSIPFVALFGKRYAELPLILNGVLDPLSGLHGPNESLHLGVFEKAIFANIHLLDELSKLETPL